MNSRIIPKSTNSTQNKMYSEPAIQIELKVDYLNTVLPFLLTHQIPFTLTSIGSSSELKGIDKNEVMAEQMKLAQKIYQKYIVEFIEKTPPKGEEIAAEMGVSEAQFKALFKKCYGKPFYQMYVDHKMEHAAQLLREGYTSVVVSERTGYAHPIKFNKIFQKYFGMTPKKYQRSLSRFDLKKKQKQPASNADGLFYD